MLRSQQYWPAIPTRNKVRARFRGRVRVRVSVRVWIMWYMHAQMAATF